MACGIYCRRIITDRMLKTSEEEGAEDNQNGDYHRGQYGAWRNQRLCRDYRRKNRVNTKFRDCRQHHFHKSG